MIIDEARAERLREAFRDRPEDGAAVEPCPPTERIWDVVSEGAGEDEVDAGALSGLVDHALECRPCADAWRLARDLAGARSAPAAVSGTAARPSSGARLWGAAAGLAAALAIASFGVHLWRQPATEPVFRGDEAGLVQSLVPETEPLPRDAFLLRWSGPEGAVYDVRVTRADLVLVAEASSLEIAEYQVPAAALQDLPAGSRLLWQVFARDAAGRQIAGEAFVVLLR